MVVTPVGLRLSHQSRAPERLDQLRYYVALPDAVQDEKEQQGWIKFGEPPFEIGLKHAIRRSVQPVPGRLVLFPSYMWHGTVPFHSGDPRLTIAFDVVPD
jgi:hypothetical protein